MNPAKTVLITGATSGIGLALAKLLAAQGHSLILTGRSAEKLERTKQELPPDVQAALLLADFTEIDAPANLFAECARRGLVVDILVNNAGAGLLGDHVDLPTDAVRHTLESNVLALTELCALFGKQMKERKGGSILNIGSTAAYQPLPYFAAYAASKAYVLHFSEALAAELAPFGVTITCYGPGPTGTNFFSSANSTPTRAFSTERFASVDAVAADAWRALQQKKMTAVYGKSTKLLLFLERLVPRRVVVAITKRMMKD